MTPGLPAEGVRGSCVVEAIRQVADGTSLLDPVVTERVLIHREIGEHLFLAEKTIKN